MFRRSHGRPAGLGDRRRRRALGAAAVAAAALAAPAVALAALALAVAAPAASAQTPTPSPTAPPPLTVIAGATAPGRGDLFLTPTGDSGTYANGAEILNRAGRELWFHQAPAGELDADFRPQTLHGRPVLTYWEGTGLGGLSDGTDYILNDHYRQIAAIHAGGDLTTDGHEFLVTDRGTAWVLSYDPATVDLSSIGGPTDQTVTECYVQEVDIRTGRVLFSWDAADHVPYSQSEQPLPASPSQPWDWFHVNAVKPVPGGNLLVSARNTWTTYKLDRRTGQILWQLGGKASSFQELAAPGQQLNDAGEIFAWQHDPEPVGPDEYTVFDNESAGAGNTGQGSTAELDHARVVTIRIDPRARTATLIASDDQPEGQVASSQGNGQPLPDGGEFVGWGILPSVSEFDAAGSLVFNAQFPAGANTYRAYLDPWNVAPGNAPPAGG